MRTAAIAALAGAVSLAHASALPEQTTAGAESYGIAGYWGDDDLERGLASYCNDSEDIDIVIVSFLSNFGNGAYPNSGISGIGPSCTIRSDQSFSGCEQVGKDITTCQKAGKKVFLSVGGAAAKFGITSQGDAKGIAYSLWNSYANPSVVAKGTPRPFGNAVVDGWDFDIESHPQKSGKVQNPNLGLLVNTLRGYFKTDTSRSYYISGAPECPLPIANMDESIHDAQYDYLWIQFYNNYCSVGNFVNDPNKNPVGGGPFNFQDWPGYLANGASKNAKLYVGIPANPYAADTFDFVPASKLNLVVKNVTGVQNYNGFMVYDLGSSDNTTTHGCTYAQNLAKVLSTGSPC